MGKIVRAGRVVGGLPFGGAVAPGDLVGWSANALVKANAVASGNIPAIGVAVNGQASGDAGSIAVGGVEVEGFAALTVGADQYLSATVAGSIQETVPATVGQYKQRVGYAVAADRVAFNLPVLGEVVTGSQAGVFTQVVGTGGVAAGDLAGWGSGGDAGKLIKATAAAGASVPAVAVAAAAYNAGATGTFLRSALVTVAGRTAGAAQYLATAGNGASQEAVPSVEGQLKQKVGYALSATQLLVTFPGEQDTVTGNQLGVFTQVVGTGGVTAGALCGWGSGGDAGKMVLSDARTGSNVPAVAVAAAAYDAGATGTFYRSALVTVAGRTPGAVQYVKEAADGGTQEAAPGDAGDWKQRVGWAQSATQLFVCFPEIGVQV